MVETVAENDMTALSKYFDDIMKLKNVHMPVSIFDPVWILQDSFHMKIIPNGLHELMRKYYGKWPPAMRYDIAHRRNCWENRLPSGAMARQPVCFWNGHAKH